MGKTDLQKQFGSSVREWRGRLGISQEALAERAGLHRTYVCDIERGARNVSLKSIEKLAKALEVTLAQIFSYAENPSSEIPAAKPLPVEEVVDILFVEHRSDDAERALQALRSANVTNRIHVVPDGAAALDFLLGTGKYAQRRPARRPQMILLDLNLPRIKGVEVLRRIKSDPRTRSIPAVVLAASKSDRDILRSQRLGADAHIVKPVDFQKFSEVASRLSLQWALLKSAPLPGPGS